MAEPVGEEQLQATIYQYWERRLGTPATLIDVAGTSVVAEEERRGLNRFTLYRYGKRSLIRCAPEQEDLLAAAVGKLGENRSLSPEMIFTYFDQAAYRTLAGTDNFLEPDALQPVPVPASFSLRRIDGDKPGGAAILAEFFGVCSEKDLDEADIWVEKPDPVIFGMFEGERMIAYASHRPESFYPRVVDIGVLIRPGYRGRGLGRAVVTADVLWCLQNDVIPMYRYDNANQPSARLAHSLGFRPRLQIDFIAFTAEQTQPMPR